MRIFVIAAIAAQLFIAPAQAATAAQRVSILKYYYCLANPLVVDKSRCHL